MAVTATLRAMPPSASSCSPPIRLAAARGVTLSRTRTPSATAVKGEASGPATSELGEVIGQLSQLHLDEPDGEQHDEGGEIEPAKIGHILPDRPVDGLGQPVDDVEDHRDRAVVGVDHPETDQPARDHRDDYHPPIDVEDREDDP